MKIPIPYFIVNPVACSGKAIRNWEIYRKEMEIKNLRYEYVLTGKCGEGKRLASNAIEKGFNILVAFGGDGTLSEVLNGILMSENNGVRLGFIPVGSSNDYIKNFSAQSNNLFGAISRGKNKLIDAVKVECFNDKRARIERYFIVNSSVGVISNAIDNFNRQTKLNKLFKKISTDLDVVISGLKAIFRYKPFKSRVRINGKIIYDGELVNLSVLKNPHFGGGMNYNIRIPPDSGEFIIVGIDNMSAVEMISLIPKFYNGSILNHRKVWMYNATNVEIESEREEKIEADGEIEGRLPAKYTIIPKAVSFII